jgi:MraZ protein
LWGRKRVGEEISVLSGRFDHALDEKGRVSIPVRFRDVFQTDAHDHPYITNHTFEHERCLALYPHKEWARLIGRIAEKAQFDPNVQRFLSFYVGGAHEVELDKQGRILIPPDLRTYAHLDREVTFSGQLNRVELWDHELLQGVIKKTEEQFISDPDLFIKLGI